MIANHDNNIRLVSQCFMLACSVSQRKRFRLQTNIMIKWRGMERSWPDIYVATEEQNITSYRDSWIIEGHDCIRRYRNSTNN